MPCKALVITIDQGKTIKDGRIQYASCVRATRVDLCPMNALSMWLFYRYHFWEEPFPNLSDNREWFPLMLVFKKTKTKTNPKVAIDYDKMKAYLSEGFNAAGLMTSKPTHAMRAAGAAMLDLKGVDLGQIRRHGRWQLGVRRHILFD